MRSARVNAGVVRAIAAAGTAAAQAAVERASDRVAARAARIPGVMAEAEAGAVRLRGRGLLARAFGSRRRSADPGLSEILAGDER